MSPSLTIVLKDKLIIYGWICNILFFNQSLLIILHNLTGNHLITTKANDGLLMMGIMTTTMTTN